MRTNLQDKIKTFIALKLQRKRNFLKKSNQYRWNSPVYLFTNENIHDYLIQLDNLKNKKVLCVAGGGDHVFESILAGSKYIDCFDINYLQKHIIELKSKMIIALPYNEFMAFFFDKKEFMNKKIIAPIFHTFSSGLQQFLNMYYKSNNLDYFEYRGPTIPRYDIKKISYIRNVRQYNKLKKLLPTTQINFINSNCKNIINKTNQTYDVVLLSNIFNTRFTRNNIKYKLSDFYNKFVQPIFIQCLNPNGKICFAYIYDDKLYNSCLKQSIKNLILQKNTKISSIIVDSINKGNDSNIVLYCKKKL